MSAFRPAILAGLLPAALMTTPACAARHKADIQLPPQQQGLQISQMNGDFFVQAAAGPAPVEAPAISLGKGVVIDAALFGSRFQPSKELGQ